MTSFVQQFNKTYRKPHRFRDELKRHGFKQVALATYLDITPAYLYQLLGGYCHMPDHLEAALASLVVAAEAEAQREEVQRAA